MKAVHFVVTAFFGLSMGWFLASGCGVAEHIKHEQVKRALRAAQAKKGGMRTHHRIIDHAVPSRKAGEKISVPHQDHSLLASRQKTSLHRH
ncbi:MAG: hypothetical protein CL920_23545 [Deltaproteobacteria bacterium]|nr:hypothetical protein [Deltaproteobacteria bacterium]MBU51676.1 hypothetical protein [Deltaproteobacteria bacterium]